MVQWLPAKFVLSGVRLSATARTVAHQAPLSMGIFRQGYWSGLPFPSPGEADSPELKIDSLPTELPGESCLTIYIFESRSVMSDSL